MNHIKLHLSASMVIAFSWVYAHIHRAAYTYYYQHSRWGIKSPPLDGKLLKQRVHIGAMDKAGRAHSTTSTSSSPRRR